MCDGDGRSRTANQKARGVSWLRSENNIIVESLLYTWCTRLIDFYGRMRHKIWGYKDTSSKKAEPPRSKDQPIHRFKYLGLFERYELENEASL